MVNENTNLSWAIAYSEMGWHIFPIKPGKKIPATEHGFHDATTDLEQIKKWWTTSPDAGIGLRTGQGEKKVSGTVFVLLPVFSQNLNGG